MTRINRPVKWAAAIHVMIVIKIMPYLQFHVRLFGFNKGFHAKLISSCELAKVNRFNTTFC